MMEASLPRIVKLTDPATELWIEHVQLFDSVEGRMHADQTVIVRGDRIVWAGASADPAIPAAGATATRVDGRGKTLLPGFIDAHVHIIGSASPLWWMAVPNIQRNLEASLYAGVTSVLNLGGAISQSAGLREALRSGGLEGPDLYIAVGQFTAVGGYPTGVFAASAPVSMRETLFSELFFQADTVSDFEKHLAQFKAAAPDVMKIMIDKDRSDAPVINDDVLRRAVAEARALGIPVVAHVGSPQDAMRALDAGLTGLAHMPYNGELTDEQVSRLAEGGIYVMTTLKILDQMADALEPDHALEITEMAQKVLAPNVVEALRQRPDDYEFPEPWPWLLGLMVSTKADKNRNMRRLYKAGAKIVVATDAGSFFGTGHGHSMHEELETVVAAGLPTTAALQGATIQAARCMQIDQEVGSIEAGKQADLVLLGADPTADIRNTTRIEAVYSKGRLVRRLP
jgi:imidazolonepropionase-like amidohydrolase